MTEGGNDTVSIALATAPADDVTVTVTPVNNLVNLGAGLGQPVSLTFTAGNGTTPQIVTITVPNNHVIDGSRSSILNFDTLSADPNYDLLTPPSVNVTINDSAGPNLQVTHSAGATIISEDGTVTDTFQVAFVNGASATSGVTVTLTPTSQVNFGAGQGVPFNLVFSQAQVQAGTALTVTPTTSQDTAAEGLQSNIIVATTTSSDANFNAWSGSLLDVQIQDDTDGATAAVLSIPRTLTGTTGQTVWVPVRFDSVIPRSGTEALTSLSVEFNYVSARGTANTPILSAAAITAGATLGLTSLNTGNIRQIITFTIPYEGNFSGDLLYIPMAVLANGANELNLQDETEVFKASGQKMNLNPVITDLQETGADGLLTGSASPPAPAIVVTQTGGTTDVTEGGATDTITVNLAGSQTQAQAPGGPQNVTVTVTPNNSQIDIGAGAGVARTLTFQPGNLNVPQTITITAIDDLAIEGNHTSLLSFSSASTVTAYNNLTAAAVTVNITDNDSAPAPTVTSIDDGDADNLVAVGAVLNYTVTFSTDMQAATVDSTDFNNSGTAGITVGTVTETTPTSGIFTFTVTTTSTGTLILRIPAGATLTSQAGGNLVTPVLDNDTVTVQALPTATIDDGDADNLVAVGAVLNYTVTFSVDMDNTTVSNADFTNSGTAGITVGTVTETTPTSGIFTFTVTANSAGTLILQIPSGATVTSAAGGNAVTPIVDNDTVTVQALPTVTSIDDGDADNITTVGTPLTYTITFSVDMDSTTFSNADLNNAGTATITIGAPSETTPTSGIFTVTVTPTTTGTIILRLPAGATVSSAAGGSLATPVQDNDTVTVNAGGPTTTTYINEVLFSPGDFSSNEYVELRGIASSTIAANTYFVVLDGDISATPGQIDQVINVSGATFGSNGFLAIVQSGHPFSINASSGTLTASWSAFENGSASYLLITSAVAPVVGGDVDSDNDGVLDGGATSWTFLDSVASLDASGADIAYGQTVFKYASGTAIDPDGAGVMPTPNIIRVDQAPYNLVNGTPGYLGRLGDSTGATAADWLYTDTETMTTQTASPRVYKVGANVAPLNMVNTLLNHLGTTNPAAPPPPGVNVTAISGNTTEAGGTATFNVTLNTQPTANVTIPVVSLNTAEGTVSTALLTFTNANWNVVQTVTVTGVNDNIDDGDIVFTVELQNTTSTDPLYNNLNPADVSVTNVDNDTRGVTVSAISGNTTEAGGTATFTIVLTTQPTASVTIPLSSSNTNEGTVGVSSVTFTTANWMNAQTVTVTGVNDDVDDGDIAYQIVTGVATGGDYGTANFNPNDVNVTNTDNDTAGVTVSTISGNTTEAGGTATFTVVLTSRPTSNVTINFVSSNTNEGTVPASVTFLTTGNDWSTAKTITVTGVNDDVDDGNIAYTIQTTTTSSDGLYSAINPNDVAVINTDDDTAGVTVSTISGNTTEAGGTATFTVVLTSRPTSNVTINFVSSNTNEGTVPASVTFLTTGNDWSTAKTVTVTGVNDDVDDGNIAYTIQTTTTSSDATYAAINPNDVAVTNTDDDTAGVTVNPTSGLVTTEAGGTATFTVVLTSRPTSNVTINFVSSNTNEGTVPAGVTFLTTGNDWSTAKTITVTGVNDFVDDGDIAYTIQTTTTSSDGLYSAINPADVSVTNTDNDTAGFTVTPTSGLTTTESGGTATFTVVLNSQPTANVTLSITSTLAAEGTASPPSLTFTGGIGGNWNTPQTVTVTGQDDAIVDGNLAYTITTGIASSSDPLYNGVNPPDVSVTNNDNDVLTFSVNVVAASIAENAGAAATTVVITRNGNASTPAQVVTLGSNDTSEATIQATVNMPLGVNSVTVNLDAVDDVIVDGPQTVTITASASGYVSGTDTVVVSDNDSPGVTVAPTSGLTTTEAGGTATFSVVLTTMPSSSVTINLSSSDTTEGTVPASITFTTGNWNVTQNVTVTGVDDLFIDGNIAYTIVTTASSADTNYNNITVADVSLTNTDNDVAGFVITPTSGLVTSEAGATANFTVRLTSQPSADVTISLTSSDTAEGTVSPPSLTFTNGNWNVNQLVTITGVNDLVVDGNVAYSIITGAATSSDTNYNGLNPTDVSVTNNDNDTLAFTVNVVATSIAENGGPAATTVVITRNGNASTPAQVVTLGSNDTSEATIQATVNMPLGVNSVTVNLDAVDDLIADGTQTVTVTASASGYTSGSDTVQVTDNDTAGVTVNPTSGLTTTEAGGTATFTVVLTSQPTAPVTVNLLSSDTTEGTVPVSITFTTGNWNVAQTVTVTGVNDLTVDGDIAYTIQTTITSSDTTYAAINPADVSVTNTDNDVAGVTVNPIAGLTTTEAGGTATFTVVLNTQPTSSVTINLSSNDTTEGTVPASITFTTGNWNIAQTVTVTGVNDALVDGNIAYSIVTTASSSDPVYNNIAVADVSVTNTDNDAAGVTITPSSGLTTTEAGGTATFSVVLTAQPSSNVTINLTSSNTNEGTVPAGVTFTNANWNIAQIVTVTGVDDFVDDGNVAYTIVTTVTSSDAAFAAVNPVDVSVTNADNDTAGITMTQSGGTTNVTEGGATDTLSFVLQSQPTSNVTIALNTGSQLSSNVPSVVFTPGNWNVTQIVTISAFDDAVSEGNHTGTISFSITSSDPLYASQAIGNVTANITDNDNVAPTAVNDGVYNMFTNTTLVVNNVGPHGLGVIANDIDPDSTTLTATLSPAIQPGLASHTLVLNSNGSFSFTPQIGFTGPVSFTYIANDGLQNSNVATVSINVVALTGLTPVINGQADADNIIIRRATNGTDVEVLVDGVVQAPFPLPYSSLASITVNGLGGNDAFQVDYTNGDPIPPGGLSLDGGTGTDTLNVNGMDAILTGRTVTATETTIDGIGAGVLADITFGTFEAVNLQLTGGDDIITTDLDNTTSPIATYTINGRGGNDTFNAPAATNIPTVNLWGGAGDDVFGSSTARVFPSVSTRINVGGEESNTGANIAAPTGDRLWLDITNASNVVSLIDTVGGNVQGIGFADMQFHGIELFDVTDNGPLNLPLGEAWTHGYDWEQTFNYYNQSGNLFLGYTSPGGTRTFALLGVPSLMSTLGGNLNDTMSMNFTLAGVVKSAFYGMGGDDKLTGSGGADLLIGGPGNDNLKGGGGSDELWGDDRSTTVNGISRDGTAAGGNDTIDGGDGDDFVFGGGGNDYITDAGGNDYLMGGLGNDIITDTAGDNFIRGGDGVDQLTGGTGRDIILGGAGNDRVIGRSNTDFMFGGDGADVIQDDSVGNDVTVADISPYDDDVMVFTQPGASISGFSNNDLALQALMFTGGVRPNAWSGAVAPGATTSSPAPFATRVSNLAGLAAGLTGDGDVDQILGNVGDVDYILSEATRDVRLNAAGDTLYNL